MHVKVTRRGFTVSCKVKELKYYLATISAQYLSVKEYVSKYLH